MRTVKMTAKLKVPFETRGKNNANQVREFEIRLKMKMLDTFVTIFESLCHELCPLFKQLLFNGIKRSCVHSALCMYFSSNQWPHFSNGKNFPSCVQLVQVLVLCDHMRCLKCSIDSRIQTTTNLLHCTFILLYRSVRYFIVAVQCTVYFGWISIATEPFGRVFHVCTCFAYTRKRTQIC